MRVPLIIAHRGASSVAPENSLAAFEAARRLGADGVELDIRFTADGVAVVHHDAAVGGLVIARTPLADLRTVSPHKGGEPAPTLEQALAVLGPHLEVFVELKALDPANDRTLLATLAAGPAPARIHVHAFDHRLVRRLKHAQPDLSCGVLSCAYPVRPFLVVDDAEAGALWQDESLLDAALAGGARAHGVKLYAWTVDDADRMRALADMGVDGICTNRPDLARETLR